MKFHERAADLIRDFLWAPGVGGGECPLSLSEKRGKTIVSTVYVQWHGDGAPRSREIADILKAMGATRIKISHALYDEINDEEDGRGPCGASLTVEFVMPDAGDDEISETHLIPFAESVETGELVTAKEAREAAR